MCTILNHVAEPPQVVEQLARVLKPGGALVLIFNNWASLGTISDLAIEFAGAVRRTTPSHKRLKIRDVERWTRAAGLAPVALTGLGIVPQLLFPVTGHMSLPLVPRSLSRLWLRHIELPLNLGDSFLKQFAREIILKSEKRP